MTPIRDEWIGVGAVRRPLRPPLRAGVEAGLRITRAAFPQRLVARRWLRYTMDLARAAPPPPDVSLTPVSDAIVTSLRSHRDSRENQLLSGLRFWDLGFRGAWVWLGEEGPLCIQWLMTPEDNPRLPALGEWAGMYPPLDAGCGRVENLFTFSNVRRKGVATQFELALFGEARRRGFVRILTHIAAENVSANRWAERMGWAPHGEITRYQLDVPWVRRRCLCVHRDPPPEDAQAPASVPAAAVPAAGGPLGVDAATVSGAGRA